MNEQHKYRSTDKMSDLICDNYSLLMVMSRFGLSLGFGDKSVKDVCEAQGVDCPTFLAVANFISEEQYSYSGNESDFSIPALMDYLKRAHTYFLDFNLPAIRRKLIEAIDCSSTNDVAYLILKFFDEYAKEVRRHMEYENQAVFTYVEQLLQGRLSDEYNIATFASKHNQIDTKLKELKNIIIKYYPEKENNNLLNAVLFDIFKFGFVYVHGPSKTIIHKYPEAHPDKTKSTNNDKRHFPTESFGKDRNGERSDQGTDRSTGVEDGSSISTVFLREVLGSYFNSGGEVTGFSESKYTACSQEAVHTDSSDGYHHVSGGSGKFGSTVQSYLRFCYNTTDCVQTGTGRPYADSPEESFLRSHPVHKATGKEHTYCVNNREYGSDSTVV